MHPVALSAQLTAEYRLATAPRPARASPNGPLSALAHLQRMLRLALALIAAQLGGASPRRQGPPPAGLRWFVDPLSLRVPAHRRTPFPSSAAGLDLAAQLGEVEQQQLWIVAPVDAELTNISVVPQALVAAAQQPGPSFAAEHWRVFQVGFVKTSPTKIYNCTDSPGGAPHACRSGFHGDVLLPAEPAIPLVLRNTTQPIVLQVAVPRDARPGNYSGRFLVSGLSGPHPFTFPVEVRLEVWPISLPLRNSSESFSTLFSFDFLGLRRNYYPSQTAEQVWGAWLPFLASHRISGDRLTVEPQDAGHPNRSLAMYEAMAGEGAKWMNLMDSWSWRGHTPNASSIIARFRSWLQRSGMASRPDLLRRSYIYGL